MNVVVTKFEPEHGEVEIIGINYEYYGRKRRKPCLSRRRESGNHGPAEERFPGEYQREIRTPLNAIVGFSGLLVDTEDMRNAANTSKIVQENNDLLLQLISDILGLIED